MKNKIEITDVKDGLWCHAEISGDLDAETADLFEQMIMSLIDGNKKVALDLEKLRYISSAGLRVILKLSKHAEKTGTKIVICSAQNMVSDILDNFGIEEICEVYKTFEDVKMKGKTFSDF